MNESCKTCINRYSSCITRSLWRELQVILTQTEKKVFDVKRNNVACLAGVIMWKWNWLHLWRCAVIFFCSENHPFRCHLLDHLQVLMAAVHHLAKMLKHIHSHIIVATFQGKLTAATTSVSVCIGLSWSSGWAGTKFEKKSVCHCLRSQNVWLKEVNVLAWLTSECISRQSPSRPAGDLVIYPALGCHCFLTGPLKSVTILWPVPNYIGWGQRHIYVNNLPRVVTLWWNDWELNLRPEIASLTP